MYNARYGSRSFVLLNHAAYEIVEVAQQWLDKGHKSRGDKILRLAVQVEAGDCYLLNIDKVLAGDIPPGWDEKLRAKYNLSWADIFPPAEPLSDSDNEGELSIAC